MTIVELLVGVPASVYFMSWVAVSVIFPHSYLKIFIPLDALFRD